MTTQPQQPNPIQDNYYYPDDEIELIDYLRVLWKWKRMIILVTFVCVVAAGVVSFMMPKIYEVSTTIEPGVVGIDGNGGPIYLDSATNIKGKIESGIYNSRILKSLNIDPRKTELKFKVANPQNTNLIKISSEWEQDKIATGTKVFAQLVTELSHDYEEIIQAKTEGIDKEILLQLGAIQGKTDQIDFKQTVLKNIKARENKLNQEVIRIKDDTKKIKQQRNKILKGKSGGDNILPLLYLTAVQQNMAYFNQLNNELYNLKSEEEKMTTEIEQLKKDMHDINTETDRLNIKKSYIEDIKLISEPRASTSPIKPKTKLNIALAGVVGFMLAVFMAFFAEYIRKSKEEGGSKEVGRSDT